MVSQRSWQGLDLRGYRRSRCLFIFVLLALPLSATTYYVDNCMVTGSDSNNGTSTSTPWLTIAHVNAQSFNPGDSILFQRSCTWREQLTVPSSGSSGNLIIFGAYGSGALPIISGADLATSWTPESVAGFKVYYASLSAQPSQVFENNVRYSSVASKNLMTPGTFYWDSGNSRIYIRTTGDNSPTGYTVEASQRDYAIYMPSRIYINVTGLQLEKANLDGLYAPHGNAAIISGSVSQYNYASGFNIEDASGTGYDSTAVFVTGNTAAHNGLNGFKSYHSSYLTFDHDVTHNDSERIGVGFTAGFLFADNGSDGPYGTLQYSEAYDEGLPSRTLPLLYDNGGLVFAANMGGYLTIQFNRAYNTGGIQLVGVSHSVIAYNVLYDNFVGLEMLATPSHINGYNTIIGNTFYANNYLVGGTYWGGIGLYGNFDGSGSTAGQCIFNTVKNNISVGHTQANLSVGYGCENDGTMGHDNVYTYNDFGPEAADFIQWGGKEPSNVGNVSYSTYSAWESATGNCGSTGCSHSVQSDPLFTNAGGADFTLQAKSPAIDAGINLGSTYQFGLGPSGNFPWGTLNQNTHGSGWEIGAFVFVQPRPAPPTSVSVTVQ